MCLGIPMQVISVSETMALCRGPDGETLIDILLVTPVLPGDWLLTFLGAARGHLDADDAGRISQALGALAAIERGEPFDVATFFPDLVDREPQLPEFLRGKS
ncbi:MAG: HypC/HybG/HupF family hydrogenase formation chaperone [Proteobacteria bacterium]|nr:HypC/HybG/HupF family hydrogenase formation chaperone [Pseudomonadota bacterium]